jgi:hypothetical protein
MKASKQFALGQKIPASVKPFSRQEVDHKLFSAKHSSLFRILTKWAESLEAIFKNPEEYIKRRTYSFKNIDNELCTIDSSSKNGFDKLVSQVEKEYAHIKKRFNELLQVSYGYIGKFLGKSSDGLASSVHRFS